MSDPLADLLRRDAARLAAPGDLPQRIIARLARRRRRRLVLMLLTPALAACLVVAWSLGISETQPLNITPSVAEVPSFQPIPLTELAPLPPPLALPSLAFASEASALASDVRGIGRFFAGCLPSAPTLR